MNEAEDELRVGVSDDTVAILYYYFWLIVFLSISTYCR